MRASGGVVFTVGALLKCFRVRTSALVGRLGGKVEEIESQWKNLADGISGLEEKKKECEVLIGGKERG